MNITWSWHNTHLFKTELPGKAKHWWYFLSLTCFIAADVYYAWICCKFSIFSKKMRISGNAMNKKFWCQDIWKLGEFFTWTGDSNFGQIPIIIAEIDFKYRYYYFQFLAWLTEPNKGRSSEYILQMYCGCIEMYWDVLWMYLRMYLYKYRINV